VASEPAGRGTTAFIGIGSNLSDPARQVTRAFGELQGLPATRLAACSALYRTAPVGPRDQPDFVNAAARLETRLAAGELLAALQAVERAHGRVRDGTRWGPRTLDLDILLFGDAVIHRPGLRIPHPELSRRAFVLVPLSDVAPAALRVPGYGFLGELLAACPRDDIRRLGSAAGCGRAAALAESTAQAASAAGRASARTDRRDSEPRA
jgi:2-amino-4-hydroxy-6-hydroxymethyldihydropteridine diphosphokinase